MRILLCLVIVLLLCSCKSVTSFNKEIISVDILNDYIGIPYGQNPYCTDTILIEFTNLTDNDFVFSFEDSLICFYDHKLGPELDFICDPIENMAIKFLSHDLESLEISQISGFDPDAFENIDQHYPKNSIKRIPAMGSILLKALLKFPNKSYFGTLTQEVSNLDEAKFVEFVVAVSAEKTRKYLDFHHNHLSSSERLIDIKKSFLLETVVKCK